MNAIFSIIMTLSLLLILIFNPQILLATFSNAVEKSAKLTLTLLCVYVVWCGFSALIEKSNLTTKLSKLFMPIIKFLFGNVSPKTQNLLSMNLSCNLLGLNGLATPYAIDALKNLEEENNENAKTMLFVVSATSIQLLPTSVMQLLTQNGLANASYIILPSLIATLISTVLGVLLCKVFK
ncbi:MAG: hypothetical protein J6R29_01475, partial [Clostridia bacterium]|nr:hypothetical protein [Clostridia bacterium]